MMIRTMMAMMVAALVLACGVSPARAAEPETKAQLKAKFEKRFPQLEKLKEQGKLGENWQGYVEAVKGADSLDAQTRTLMDEENADRTKLYQIIAKEVENGSKELPIEKVAERNARRNFENSTPGEYLKLKDGRWIQRQEVTALKKEGKVGETWQGTVEAIKPGELDAQAQAVITEENRIRKELYERAASKHGTTAAKEAEKAGQKNIDAAKPGEWIKIKDGAWSKK